MKAIEVLQKRIDYLNRENERHYSHIKDYQNHIDELTKEIEQNDKENEEITNAIAVLNGGE